MMNPLSNNTGYGDPLRSLTTFSGTIVKVEDIVDYQVLGNISNPDKSFTGNKTEVLSKMKDTAKAVRNLLANEDFKQLMWYFKNIVAVTGYYGFNPSLDPNSRSVWLNEMAKMKAFETIINDFVINNESTYEQLLQEHLAAINNNDI